MANPIPNSLALVNIAPGAAILSADHRSNYADIQARMNALITALSGGVAGQALLAAGASSVQWGSAGAMTQLYDSTLGVAAANFDVSSISQTYSHLRLILMGRMSGAIASGHFNLTFNGDSAANYGYEYNYMGAATPGAAASATGQTSILCGDVMPGSTALANKVGVVVYDIPSYAQTTFHKSLVAAVGGIDAATRYAGRVMGDWASAAAINRITLTPASGNFVAGSRLSIYGVL